MTTVTAAVIERGGRILICRRRPEQKHGGKWEFPGGKQEEGESRRDSLRRELHEELRIEARIESEITRYQYQYPGREPVRLVFFRVREFSGEPDYAHFDQVRWVKPEEMPTFDFLEGDVAFVRELAAAAST